MATVIHSHSNSGYTHAIKFDHTDIERYETPSEVEFSGILPDRWVLRDACVYVNEPFMTQLPANEPAVYLNVELNEPSGLTPSACWFSGVDLTNNTGPILNDPWGSARVLACAYGNHGGNVVISFGHVGADASNWWAKGQAAVLLNVIDAGEIAKGIT